MTEAPPRLAAGVRDLVAAYDLFLLDQYGVLHDGEAPYPGAVAALERLRHLGKRLCVLTNSGRSARHNLKLLTALGFAPASFERVVTSGDMALDWLRRERPRARCFALCPPADAQALRAAGVRLADDLETADLIVLTVLPMPAAEVSEAALAPLLEAGVRRGLPLVCANPDRRGPQGKAVTVLPGEIAEWYRRRGGAVRHFGKPRPEFFRFALSFFPEVPAARAVMLGDTPETDLLGAAAAGLDAAFVTGGVHRGAFAACRREARPRLAAALLEAAGTRARWLLPGLAW